MPYFRRSQITAARRSSRTHFRVAIRTIWNETSSTLKRAWIALWAVGAALLAFGAWGDSSGFWSNKPYLSNTFSEMTSAAFGVPVALVLLQRLASFESAAAESRSARRMARRVSADLESTVRVLAGDDVTGMRAALEHLREQRESLLPQGDYWHPPAAPKLHYQPYIDAIEGVLGKVGKLFAPGAERHLAEVSSQWSILATESRFRLLATENNWLPGLQAEQLGSLVTTVTGNALRDWRQKGLELRDWYRREDRQPESTSYGEMDTLRACDIWFSDIINYICAVIDLADEAASAARALASPDFL
jgi:hypothetical protein